MTKKAYVKPAMNVVRIQQQHIICASQDTNGMNTKLQSQEVSGAWSRGNSDWDERSKKCGKARNSGCPNKV